MKQAILVKIEQQAADDALRRILERFRLSSTWRSGTLDKRAIAPPDLIVMPRFSRPPSYPGRRGQIQRPAPACACGAAATQGICPAPARAGHPCVHRALSVGRGPGLVPRVRRCLHRPGRQCTPGIQHLFRITPGSEQACPGAARAAFAVQAKIRPGAAPNAARARPRLAGR